MAHTRTEAPPAASRRDFRIWVALALGLALAAAAGLFAYGIGTSEPLWVVVVLAALSFVGLATLFAALLGFVHVGRLPSQRAFFDAMANLRGLIRPGASNLIVVRVYDCHGAAGLNGPVWFTTGPAEAGLDFLRR